MSKSKPYSSVSVKGVDGAMLARTHAGQACVLGVDVAKFELMAVLRWADGSFERPWRVVNPGGLGLLVAKLVGRGKRDDGEKGISTFTRRQTGKRDKYIYQAADRVSRLRKAGWP